MLMGIEFSHCKGMVTYSETAVTVHKQMPNSHRIRQIGPLPAGIEKEISTLHAKIQTSFQDIVPDLQKLNVYRYSRNLSGGIQEFMEAVSFQHYIETGTLISYDEAKAKLPEGVLLSEEDFVGGLFDLGGEMMRFAITAMATNVRRFVRGDAGNGDTKMEEGDEKAKGNDPLVDMRDMRMYFEKLNFRSGFDKERERKMQVLKESVEKVEMTVYGLVVRGSERPEGWMPDVEIAKVKESDVLDS
jgi:hypothetical protein